MFFKSSLTTIIFNIVKALVSSLVKLEALVKATIVNEIRKVPVNTAITTTNLPKCVVG